MRNSIARKLIAIVAAALLVFSVAILFVIDNTNKKSAKDYAVNLLGVFETQMLAENYKTTMEYKMLVELSDNVKNIRVSVIDFASGDVLADTFSNDPDFFKNHSTRRPEIVQAKNGDLGSDIRDSETFGVNSLYVARSVEIDGAKVILRVSIPVNSINAYLVPVFTSMAVIFIILLVLVFVVSKALSSQLIMPVNLIKQKLQTVGVKDENNPIGLTKYDEVNEILTQVDELSNRLDEALISRESEKEKLNFILESINQGIIAVDKSFNVLMMNQVAADIFDREVVLPTNIVNVARNPMVTEALSKTLASGQYQTFDITLKENRLFEFRILPALYEDIHAIIIILDVTDTRKLQLEKQEFFQNASHELNTPLTSVLGYSEILLKEEKYNATFLKAINKEASRMQLLISDMLQISDLESGTEIIDEPLRLDSLVKDVIESLKIKAEAKNIAIEQNLIAANIKANPEKIKEVVGNLLDNAIKYTENGGHIILSTAKAKGKLVFSVKDNGIGIPRQDLNRVFERFFRVDKGRSKSEGGTGLGLAIVKHICNYYKAPISIKSEIGIGTEISIMFDLV